LLWLVNGESAMRSDALAAIASGQRDGALFVSPVSGWELAVAAQKSPGPGRPDLGGDPPAPWFRKALRVTGAKIIPIGHRLAIEAADVAAVYARKDPGDRLLIATARVRRIPIITRDRPVRDLARDRPDYVSVIAC
jgi:PIN domain nuclease of toxin-antitoxin system